MTNVINIKKKYINLLKSIIVKDSEVTCQICDKYRNNFNLFQSLLIADTNEELVKAKLYEYALKNNLNISDLDSQELSDFELSEYNITLPNEASLRRIFVTLNDDIDEPFNFTFSTSPVNLSALYNNKQILIQSMENTTNENIQVALTITRGEFKKVVIITILADKTKPLYDSLSIT